MFTLPHDVTIGKAINQLKKHRFSRTPVYQQERNNIIGVLNAKDLLAMEFKQDSKPTSIADIIRSPHFVPQDTRIHDVLKEFQEKKIHSALVVNTVKKVIGLVTMDDVLEELFGEIYDEFDTSAKEEK